MNNKRQTKIDLRSISDNGFGLVEAIISLGLLSAVISYGLYFTSARLNIIHSTKLYDGISKEIEKDIELLKSDLWGINLDSKSGKYRIGGRLNCRDVSDTFRAIENRRSNTFGRIANQGEISASSNRKIIHSWIPNRKVNQVFTSRPVMITRTIKSMKPISKTNLLLAKNIAKINYIVKLNSKEIEWLNIYLSTEAHTSCPQRTT